VGDFSCVSTLGAETRNARMANAVTLFFIIIFSPP
jgi:hypothetical protein